QYCNSSSSTNASYNTTSALAKAFNPRKLIKSVPPGPAPTSVIFDVFVILIRDAGQISNPRNRLVKLFSFLQIRSSKFLRRLIRLYLYNNVRKAVPHRKLSSFHKMLIETI